MNMASTITNMIHTAHYVKQKYRPNIFIDVYQNKIQMQQGYLTYITAKYVSETNMPLKYQTYVIYANYFICRYQRTMSVYISHINSMQSTASPQALVYLHFMLLAYTPKQICLQDCTCTSH